MKKVLISSLCFFLLLQVSAQKKQFDSLAIILIDRMTDVIGDLESCSFNLQTSRDIIDPGGAGLIKHFTDFNVFLSGQNKMLVNYTGDKGHRRLWYNGKQVAYYFKEEHNYGIIPAPSTTMRMIDSVNNTYQIEFPAADFFYPSFTDDLLENSDIIKLVGRSQINGQECFHILASNKEMTTQIWISADAFNLPVKHIITYKTQQGNPQYEATFSDWKVNPNLPSAMFDFEPPPGSAKVKIMSATEK